MNIKVQRTVKEVFEKEEVREPEGSHQIKIIGSITKHCSGKEDIKGLIFELMKLEIPGLIITSIEVEKVAKQGNITEKNRVVH